MDDAQEPRWRREFAALPEWAQKMVRGLAGCGGYGSGNIKDWGGGMSAEAREKYVPFEVLLSKHGNTDWWDGFFEMRSLAAAMTAPWPPPQPTPHEDLTTTNVVELIADGDCAFDQPCHFGHRVESHAVYCHNKSWPDSPRKCQRNRRDFLHEDCPGFVPLTPLRSEK